MPGLDPKSRSCFLECNRRSHTSVRCLKFAPLSPGFAPRSRNSRTGSWSWRAFLRLRSAKAPGPSGWPTNSASSGLESVHTDEVGNVFGTHPGYGHGHVSLSAHLDTVFPAGTPLNIRQQGSRLYGPGVSDNGAGVTAMLAIVAALRALGIRHALPFCLSATSGKKAKATCAACATFSPSRAGRIRFTTAWCWMARAPTPSWPRPWAAAVSK